MAAFFFVLQRAAGSYGDMPGATDPLYLQATTACLAAIVMTQVVNVFLCRIRWSRRSHFGLAATRCSCSGSRSRSR